MPRGEFILAYSADNTCLDRVLVDITEEGDEICPVLKGSGDRFLIQLWGTKQLLPDSGSLRGGLFERKSCF